MPNADRAAELESISKQMRALDEQRQALRAAERREEHTKSVGRAFVKDGLCSPGDGWKVWSLVLRCPEDEGRVGVQIRWADDDWFDLKFSDSFSDDDLQHEIPVAEFRAVVARALASIGFMVEAPHE